MNALTKALKAKIPGRKITYQRKDSVQDVVNKASKVGAGQSIAPKKKAELSQPESYGKAMKGAYKAKYGY